MSRSKFRISGLGVWIGTRTLQIFLNQSGWSPENVEPATIPADLREAHLDQGKRDTLVLAAALGGALVLMDETTGREAARALELTVRGSLGVLIQAYRQELIEADQLRLYFTEIADRHDIWISRVLVDRLQRDVLKD